MNSSLKRILKSNQIKQWTPPFIFRLLHRSGFYKNYRPAVGKIQWGDFKSDVPFSKSFGFERGGPVDRYYIENFLLAESRLIKGRVLEIGDNEYTVRFGKQHVTKSDILHVDSSNTSATIIGDLSHVPQVEDNTFDCIILTQTLHLVYDYIAVIKSCYRILKPGGVLLLTVPGLTPIDHGEWKENWLWSFNERVMAKILSEVFKASDLELHTYGNVRVAAAFLYGAGISEVPKKVMDNTDEHFPVIVTARAVKGGM
ncbi:MAG: methyltransferase domain-containing protein [Chitinophagaceae bacterium]